MDGAAVTLTDATGAVVASAIAGPDGSYTLSVPVTAKAPFVAAASKNDVVYFSPVAEAKSGTINITKLTNLIAAQLSPTGDPAALASQIASGATSVTPTQVREVVTTVVESLKPLMTNAGDTVDPISGTFSANGSGHDQVLMALDIAIQPNGNDSNINIAVKTPVSGDQQPPEITFTSGTKPPPLPQMVATAQLPSSDTDAKVGSFLARLDACYALPRTERVNGTTAASVVAAACRTLFTGDDPTAFRNNGATVGANGAFAAMFRDGSTGVKFSNPVIEFLTPQGYLLVSFKATAVDGGVTYSRLWVTRENGELKAIGNGNKYPFNVRAWSEIRDFLNRPELSYWATGFDVGLTNVTTTGGASLFAKVVVTSPNGRQTTFVPTPGLSFMTVQGTNTGVVRLAGKFMNPATAGTPRRMSGIPNGEALAWATNPDGTATDWTDAQIQAIRNVGRWKADFYLASAPTVIEATQYHETMTRPLSLSELAARPFTGLTAKARQDVIGASSVNGNVALADGERIELSVAGSPADFWTVPAGALGPSVLQAQGFLSTSTATRWNDSLGVSSMARSAIINCSPQTTNDPHCLAGTNTYSSQARLNVLQTFAYDARDMAWTSFFALYKLVAVSQ